MPLESPQPYPLSPNKIFYTYKKNNRRGEMREPACIYDLLLKALYMLVEMASTLVTTASIIIISAIILSLLVDIPLTSLPSETMKIKRLIYLFIQFNFQLELYFIRSQ